MFQWANFLLPVMQDFVQRNEWLRFEINIGQTEFQITRQKGYDEHLKIRSGSQYWVKKHNITCITFFWH